MTLWEDGLENSSLELRNYQILSEKNFITCRLFSRIQDGLKNKQTLRHKRRLHTAWNPQVENMNHPVKG